MKTHTALLLTLTLATLTTTSALAHENHDSHAANAPASSNASGAPASPSAAGRPGNAARASRTVQVSMNDNMRFTPATIAVKRGETVRFEVKNEGKLRHELVLGTEKEFKAHAEEMKKMPGMAHEEPNAVSVEPGKTGTLVWEFTRAGTFDFACLEPGHFEAGMKGKLGVK